MLRKIIEINQERCNGCGACASACAEGAIVMQDGKARLIRDDYCDGLGACLPACPTDAIRLIEREADAFDEEAVKKAQATPTAVAPAHAGCPGSMSRAFHKAPVAPSAPDAPPSQLAQWPVQMKLVPVTAPYFAGAKLLVAADCAAFAHADFHRRYMACRVTLIGCPKLDGVDYADKLTQIIRQNDIQSLTVVRMEVPCCGGLERAAKTALQDSGKFIPWRVVTLSIQGEVLSED